jgi:hypothetical protein
LFLIDFRADHRLPSGGAVLWLLIISPTASNSINPNYIEGTVNAELAQEFERCVYILGFADHGDNVA